MQAQALTMVIAGVSAFGVGLSAGGAALRAAQRNRRVRAVHEVAVGDMRTSLGLECSGLAAAAIMRAWRLSHAGGQGTGPLARAAWGRLAARGIKPRLARAGLDTQLGVEACAAARIECAVAAAAAAALLALALGLSFSMAYAAVGFAGGWMLVPWALGTEARLRCAAAEKHLSEAIEVICLGLRSGLSFDRALSLYCANFTGGLARSLQAAQQTWEVGLRTREQALREMEQSYGSGVITRVVDSIVRSMRFGSPLADQLEVLAVEARAAHKGRVEEEVMKAPVKMMIPVGTLILPSMLLLVLGPVMLDLAQGFS